MNSILGKPAHSGRRNVHHPFLIRLRGSIQDLHEQAQDTRPLDATIGRTITEEQYVAVLARLYGFMAPLD
ncbi:MAG: hypothetical protein ACOCWR_03460 [Oceanidesulfovibrio sp.]